MRKILSWCMVAGFLVLSALAYGVDFTQSGPVKKTDGATADEVIKWGLLTEALGTVNPIESGGQVFPRGASLVSSGAFSVIRYFTTGDCDTTAIDVPAGVTFTFPAARLHGLKFTAQTAVVQVFPYY